MSIGLTTVRIVLLLLFCSLLSAQIPVAALAPIRGFQMIDSRSGWAWGIDENDQFHLWRASISKLTRVNLPQDLSDPRYGPDPGAFFLSSDRGFLVWTQDQHWTPQGGQFTLMTAETQNGGQSWQIHRQEFNQSFLYGVQEMQFTDGQNGHLILETGATAGQTYKMLLATYDGGQSWTSDPSSDSVVGNENAPVHMLFLTKAKGWILRELSHGQSAPDILLFRTTTGGTEWHQFNNLHQPSACQAECELLNLSTLYSRASNPRDAFFCATYFPAHPDDARSLQVLYRTYDGGLSWSAPQPMSAPGNIHFADFEFGIAQRGMQIFLTNNGGLTWSENPAASHMIVPYRYAKVEQAQRKGRSMWVLVTNLDGTDVANALLYSDEGKTWRALPVNDSGQSNKPHGNDTRLVSQNE